MKNSHLVSNIPWWLLKFLLGFTLRRIKSFELLIILCVIIPLRRKPWSQELPTILAT
jgi:hypothetical protein